MLSDPIINNIGTAQGNFFLGAGDIGDLLQGFRGRTHTAHAKDDLLWLRRNFVYPAGFARARHVLEIYRTVFLHGMRGIGRNAAATMLLHELHTEARTFQELLVQDRRPRLDLDHVSDGDLLLLDLTAIDEMIWREIHDQMGSLRQTVCDRAAHLAVVLPDYAARTLSPGFRRLLVEIFAPRADDVMRRRLRSAGIIVLPDQPWPSTMLDHLCTGRSLEQIAHHADLVVSERDKSGGRGDLSTWSEAAHALLSTYDLGISNAVEELEGSQRALLITTAMLHGAHADDIHQASVSLLQAVEHPDDDHPVLGRTDLATRFGNIAADIDPDSGEVSFRSFGYDNAVRRHFWKNVPDIRDPLRQWVREAVGLARLNQPGRDFLVERFTELCLHERYRSALVTLVKEWTSQPTGFRLRAAALTLTAGLLDERNSSFFRQQIYDWATEATVSRGLRLVLVRTCHDVIAARHPDVAMVRLHHLARRERHETLARDALTKLARSKRRHHQFMLRRLEAGLQRPQPYPADFDLFYDLTTSETITVPGPHGSELLADPEVRERLTNGWRAVFTHRKNEARATRAHDWLITARDHEGQRDRLLNVLVSAATPRIEVLAPLYTTARDLPYTTEEERERGVLLTTTLREMISTATKTHAERKGRA